VLLHLPARRREPRREAGLLTEPLLVEQCDGDEGVVCEVRLELDEVGAEELRTQGRLGGDGQLLRHAEQPIAPPHRPSRNEADAKLGRVGGLDDGHVAALRRDPLCERRHRGHPGRGRGTAGERGVGERREEQENPHHLPGFISSQPCYGGDRSALDPAAARAPARAPPLLSSNTLDFMALQIRVGA